jgi:PKD repeat protein
MKKGIIFLFLFLFYPSLVKAETRVVIINEIAWMGTNVSYNDEWIELYNPTNQEINLEGWTLKATDGTPEIILTGTIPAQGYFLLERSDDESVPEIIADQIYTGALSNSGENLELRDSQNNLIDAVNCQDGWLAGDNQTKASMERIDPFQGGSLADNWATNLDQVGTPKALNSVASFEVPSEEPEVSEEPVFIPSAVQNHPPTAQAGQDKIALVGQEIVFDGSFSFDPDNDPLTFFWNFGNGQTASGSQVATTYQYPGQYVVTLKVSDGSLEDTDQISVIIYPTRILISEFLANPVGQDEEGEWIEIYNPSDFWVNLSGWQIDDAEGGSQPFVVPENTFLKPKNYLVFSRQITKIALNNDQDEVRILFPHGEISDAVQYQENQEGIAGARKGERIFWTEVLTPGTANLVYLSSEDSEETTRKESLLPLFDQSMVEFTEPKQITSLPKAREPNLVVWPTVVDFDDLSWPGQKVQAVLAAPESEAENSVESCPAFKDLAATSTLSDYSDKFTAAVANKLNQSSFNQPTKSLVILLVSVILSSFLFGLSLVSWRRKLSR